MSKRNTFFEFKHFVIEQRKCAMKVTTTACILGAVAKTKKQFAKILDIGTGTGVLSLMMAQNMPTTLITAIDIDANSCVQALENVNNTPFKNNINVIKVALQDFIPNYKFDVIVSNPPFFENDLLGDNVDKNIAWHSVHLSLDMLINFVKNNLQPDGLAYLLLPTKRKNELQEMAKKYNISIAEITEIAHTVNHSSDTFIGQLQFGLLETIVSKKLIIKEGENYSNAMVTIMKDFYLGL